jgi:hypothetical protein
MGIIGSMAYALVFLGINFNYILENSEQLFRKAVSSLVVA